MLLARHGSMLAEAAACAAAAGGVQQFALLAGNLPSRCLIPADRAAGGESASLWDKDWHSNPWDKDWHSRRVKEMLRTLWRLFTIGCVCVQPPVRCCRCCEGGCGDAAAGGSPQRSQSASGVTGQALRWVVMLSVRHIFP
jgi:hypothetical protein